MAAAVAAPLVVPARLEADPAELEADPAELEAAPARLCDAATDVPAAEPHPASAITAAPARTARADLYLLMLMPSLLWWWRLPWFPGAASTCVASTGRKGRGGAARRPVPS